MAAGKVGRRANGNSVSCVYDNIITPGKYRGFSMELACLTSQTGAVAGNLEADLVRCGAAHVVALRQAAFRGQHAVDVLLDQGAELAQRVQAEVGNVHALLLGVVYAQCYHFVAIAERHAFFHQVVSQVGGGGKALQHGGAHGSRLHGDAAHHVGVDTQGVDQRVGGVEQRLFVFLVVLVVGQRLRLHQRHQGDQVADNTAGFAAYQLRYVRVFLLRHDGAAGAEAVGDIDEADARAHPQDQLFGQAAQVHHHQAGGGGEFDGEVTVGHGVQRIVAHIVKTQQLRGVVAVDGEGGAGQRGGAQRQAVDALAAVGHALGVAAQHFHVSQHVVAEGDRLCHLQVGEARHHGVSVLLGQVQQAGLQLGNQRHDGVDLRAQPQADVGGNLVVTAAAGVQALAGVADLVGEAALDVHVYVFQVDR